MNRRYRKTIIAGNWKMNKTPSETKAFAEQFKAILPKTKWCDIVVCVPTVDLSAAVRAFKDSRIAVGAENVYFEKGGARNVKPIILLVLSIFFCKIVYEMYIK